MFTPADFFVSVIIPCYKQAHFLNDAVDSVIAQTFPNWEIIIVNDGSPDETSNIATKLIEDNPTQRIRLINKVNGGLSDARNHGINEALGSWILPLDSDDKFEKTYLEKAFKKIQDDPSINLVFTNLQKFEAEQGFWDPAEFSIETLKTQNCFPYSAIYKKELWIRSAGYEIGLPWAGEDLSLWFDFAKLGLKPSRIAERLFLYRVHASGSMYSTLLQYWPEVEAMIHSLHPEIFSVQELLNAHEKIAQIQEATFNVLQNKIKQFSHLYGPHLWMAIKLHGQNKFEQALELYEKSSRLHYKPDWQIIWRQLLCYVGLSDHQNIISKKNEILLQFPEHSWLIKQVFKDNG